MAKIQRYLDGVISQHKTAPRFMAWLEEHLKTVDGMTMLLSDMSMEFDLDKAVGIQLDTIGSLVGVSRTLLEELSTLPGGILDDETYRNLIRTGIVKNQWDGTLQTIYEIWQNVFGDGFGIYIQDNQDMTISVTLSRKFAPLDTELILRGYIVPKPMGVGMNVILRTAIATSAHIHIGTRAYGTSVFAKLNAQRVLYKRRVETAAPNAGRRIYATSVHAELVAEKRKGR